MGWNGQQTIPSQSYICGYCGNAVASNHGFIRSDNQRAILICPHCNEASIRDRHGKQTPGVSPGNNVLNVPDSIDALYKEARNAVSVGSYTASVLATRKLLMNLAVAEGAEQGKRFIEYVEYLSDKGFVPPKGKGWVDHIRKKGNEATHEIKLMTQEDAIELIQFTEMLLKFIYEFPSKAPTTS